MSPRGNVGRVRDATDAQMADGPRTTLTPAGSSRQSALTGDPSRPAELRGAASQNARKTHCHNGHPLSGDNLKITSQGRRLCRACERARRARDAEARRAYGAAYRAANAEAVKASQDAWRARNADYQREWRARNAEHRREYQRAYRARRA